MRAKELVTNKLDRRLASYAVAAAAIGAVAPSATAQVIYTKADLTLFSGRVSLDLDQDGTNDFRISNQEAYSYYFRGGVLFFGGNRKESASVLGQYGSTGPVAFAVPGGTPIGSDSPAKFVSLQTQSASMAHAFFSYNTGYKLGGHWANVTNRYLGLRFTSGGGVHYGWARLSVSATLTLIPKVVAKLTGFAYEATPNKSIIAGDRGHGAALTPHVEESGATLGMLSLGAGGLNSWREK